MGARHQETVGSTRGAGIPSASLGCGGPRHRPLPSSSSPTVVRQI